MPDRPCFYSSIRAFAVFSVLMLALAGLTTQGVAQEPLKDAKGQVLPEDADARVITVGGALTEIAYALGKQDKIVAVDTTSVYPPEALKTKPNVGYMRALSAEGILALDPSLILSEAGSGPPQTIDMLQEARVPFLTIPSNYSVEGILTKIDIVGRALKAEKEAEALAESLKTQMAALSKAVSEVASEKKKKVLFLFSMRGGRLMVSGKNTQADAVIKLAGGENVVSDIEGFKPVSNEAILAANPDFVLMMSGAGAPEPNPETVFSHPGLTQTQAAKDKALVVMPGVYLLGFGPRTAMAVAELAQKLYPEADLTSDRIFTQKD